MAVAERKKRTRPAKVWPRDELVKAAGELRDQGLSLKHVAMRLGVKGSTLRNALNDPDGSKQRARKASYAGECADCGGPTDGSNGPDKAPGRCLACLRGAPLTSRRPDRRRRVPIRLEDIDQDRRMEAAFEACRREHDENERRAILMAAISPSETVYWVAA